MKGRLLALLAVAISAYIAQVALRSQSDLARTEVGAPPQVSFRLVFGGSDKQPARWDGSVQASNGRIAKLDGWHLGDGDRIDGQRWVVSIQPPLLGTVPKKA